jgi:hypothetical protein
MAIILTSGRCGRIFDVFTNCKGIVLLWRIWRTLTWSTGLFNCVVGYRHHVFSYKIEAGNGMLPWSEGFVPSVRLGRGPQRLAPRCVTSVLTTHQSTQTTTKTPPRPNIFASCSPVTFATHPENLKLAACLSVRRSSSAAASKFRKCGPEISPEHLLIAKQSIRLRNMAVCAWRGLKGCIWGPESRLPPLGSCLDVGTRRPTWTIAYWQSVKLPEPTRGRGGY